MGNFTYASARLHASSVLAKAAARQNHIGSLPSPDDLLDNCVEYVRLFDLEELVAYISHMTCLPNDVSSEVILVWRVVHRHTRTYLCLSLQSLVRLLNLCLS